MQELRKSQGELVEEIRLLKAELKKYKNRSAINSEMERLAVDKLAESELILHQFINATNDAIGLFNKDLFLIEINNTALNFYQPKATRSDLIGKHISDIYPPARRKKVIKPYLEVIETGKPYITPRIASRRFPGTIVSIKAFKVGDGLGVIVSDITEISETVTALNYSERRLNNILEHSANVYYSYDKSFNINYISKQVKDFLGYDAEEAANNWKKIISPNPANEQKLAKSWPALLQGQSFGPYELEFVDNSGNLKWGNVWESPVINEGKVIEIIGLISDITENKNYYSRLNDALLKSKKRETEKTDLLRAARSILRHNTFESAALEIYNICRKSIGALSGLIFLEPEEIEKAEILYVVDDKILKRSWATELGLNNLNPLITSFKEQQAYFDNNCENISWLKIFDESMPFSRNCLLSPLIVDGIKEGIFCFFNKAENFSERDRVLASAFSDLASIALLRIRKEEAVKHNEQLFRGMFTNMGTGVAIYESPDKGINFLFKDINPAGVGIGNSSYEFHIGKNIKEVYPGAEEMGILNVLKRVYRTGNPEHFPMRNYADDRISLWVDNYIYKIPSGDVVAVYDDKTEIKKQEEERARLEKQLNHAQKMEAVGQLAGGIAHDFNNLLTVIIGNVELLLLDLEQNDKISRDILEIANTAERASKLTQKLLTFSRKHITQKASININQILDSSLGMLERILPENIEISIEKVEDPWFLFADSNQIEQVIINLTINASDAMPEGGVLNICTKNLNIENEFCSACSIDISGEYVEICVTDTGHGIEPEHKEKIFEPYFTTKEVGRGTGLGLSIIYGIVAQHKGHILLDSTVGQGTTFKILLPRSDGLNTVPEHYEEIKEDYSGMELILVVEDNDAVRKSTVKTLQRFGYEVIEAAIATEAINMITRQNVLPDVIVSDVVMPQMSGPEMIYELEKLGIVLPTLFVSGYPKHHFQDNHYNKYDIPLLSKPFRPLELAKTVREVLGKPRNEE